MARIARYLVVCAMLTGVASANPASAVVPPFDAAKPAHIGVIGKAFELASSKDPALLEEARALLERSIAAAPQAGDTDYAVGWAARVAAKLCRQEDTLAYYTIMRKHFVGGIDAGAGGAHRDWDIHLAITRAHLERCRGSKATLAKMYALDKTAKPTPTEKLFANLTPLQIRALPSPIVDRDVRVVGAWRFDPRKNAWVSHLSVSATPRPAKVLQLPGSAAPDGLYWYIWQEPGRLVEGFVEKGTPDCSIRKGTNLDELEADVRRRCVPAHGLTSLPRFDATSMLTARDLTIVKDLGEATIQALERARPTPQDVQIHFRREGKALVVRAMSDYGRTITLEIDRLLIFDETSSTWKPFKGPTRLELQTYCTGCEVAAYHRRQANANDPKSWVPLIESSAPALLHLRGKLAGQPLAKFIFNGTINCQDVMIGTRPKMMAMCVPNETGASARFVPMLP